MVDPQRPRDRLLLPNQSYVFFTVLFLLLLFLIWYVFRPFLIYMLVGVLTAVLALPIDRFWERFFPNRVAAVCTMLTLFLVITAPFVALGFAVYGDVAEIMSHLQDAEIESTLDRALETFLPNMDPQQRMQMVHDTWLKTKGQALDALGYLRSQALVYLSEFFLALTVILFVVYYVLVDGDRLVSYLRRAAPIPARQVDFLLAEARRGLQAVFVGQILTALIQGALGGIGFLIVGLPGAILWACVMAVLSLLPIVGAFLVWIPAAIYLFASDKIWQGFFLVFWGIVVVSQVDNFVRPKLIGDRADIHPLFVLVGILGGVAAFGFIGLFLGPLLVGVLISVLKVWESDYLDPGIDRTATPIATPAPGAAAKARRRWWKR